jgi:acyl carrier protein
MMNELENELAELIIRELNIQDIQLSEVSSDTPLYGEGFGLDSIDILEIALLISKRYGFSLRSDNPENAKIFATLSGLAAYVAQHRVR